MWLKFNTKREIDGVTYLPGDWADVDSTVGRQWLVAGLAYTPNLADALPIGDECGVVLLGEPEHSHSLLSFYIRLNLTITDKADLQLPYAKTLLWQPEFDLRPVLLSIGFDLLDRWDMALPFATDGQYDTRLMFAKRSKAMIEFIQALADDIPFLDLLNEYKPNMLALPDVWVSGANDG